MTPLIPTAASIRGHMTALRDRRVLAMRRGRAPVDARLTDDEIRDSVDRYEALKYDIGDVQPPSTDG